jgi:CheY-like chemotaxis protein
MDDAPGKKRVMVVEDEIVIALFIEDVLRGAGYDVLGPFPRVLIAQDAARQASMDGALLDINIHGEQVFPVAEILDRRRIPFGLMTGYDTNTLPPAYRAQCCLIKPFRAAALLKALSRILKQV